MNAAPARCALLSLLALSACIGPRPSAIEPADDWLVTIKSVRIPDTEAWYARFAEHTWIDVRRGSERDWLRLEVVSPSSGVRSGSISAESAHAEQRWGNSVFVLMSVHGPRARRAAERMIELARAHPDFGRTPAVKGEDLVWTTEFTPAEREEYAAWPGPNSNTFVADLVRGTDELNVELHHNAVGKNYARGLRAGMTISGLGLELESDYVGVGVGLRQGAELHFLGLTLGVGLWPPALKLPLLPRLGIHQGWLDSP